MLMGCLAFFDKKAGIGIHCYQRAVNYGKVGYYCR